MMRCDKHDQFYDSDFEEDCPDCENEKSEQDDIQENTDSMEEKLEELDKCEWCGGTGEVATDVDDGEGHTMKGVGVMKKCICQYDN